MTTAAGLCKDHDVGYFKAGHGADGCAGAMAYDIDPVALQVSGMGDGLMGWRRPAPRRKDRPYASMVGIELVCAEARARSGGSRAALRLVPGRGDTGLAYSSISIPSEGSAWR